MASVASSSGQRTSLHLNGQRLIVGGRHKGILFLETRFSDGDDVREHLDAQICQKFACHARRSYAGCGFAGTCALEDVATVVGVDLERAHEVGMPRPRGHLAQKVGGGVAEGRHTIGPVLPVAVAHNERNRGAERASEANAGGHLHSIALDALAAAAAVSRLPPRQIGVDLRVGQLQPRRDAVDYGREARSMALAPL